MTDILNPYANRFLVLNDQGVVINIIVGYVDIPIFGTIPQTADTGMVSVGWTYDAVTDSFLDPGGPVSPPIMDYLNSGDLATDHPQEA